MSGSPEIDPALDPAPANAAKLALFHSPEIFDAIASRVDIAFAGHTHGGQVRAPIVGAPWTPPGSGRFTAGWYSAEDAAARMYVSRGIGTSVLPVRFWCRPEVAIVTIRPGS